MATSAAAPAVSSSQAVMQQYQRAKGDTGSPEVQVALLTNRINELTAHFKRGVGLQIEALVLRQTAGEKDVNDRLGARGRG